jgi:hypothetical protein
MDVLIRVSSHRPQILQLFLHAQMMPQLLRSLRTTELMSTNGMHEFNLYHNIDKTNTAQSYQLIAAAPTIYIIAALRDPVIAFGNTTTVDGSLACEGGLCWFADVWSDSACCCSIYCRGDWDGDLYLILVDEGGDEGGNEGFCGDRSRDVKFM